MKKLQNLKNDENWMMLEKYTRERDVGLVLYWAQEIARDYIFEMEVSRDESIFGSLEEIQY